jgi:hypothetical protein
MARKTEEAEKDFQVAARLLRSNVQLSSSGNTALDLNTFIITRNQKEMASDIAFLADGHARMAASLREVYDLLTRINAKIK